MLSSLPSARSPADTSQLDTGEHLEKDQVVQCAAARNDLMTYRLEMPVLSALIGDRARDVDYSRQPGCQRGKGRCLWRLPGRYL